MFSLFTGCIASWVFDKRNKWMKSELDDLKSHQKLSVRSLNG